MSASATSTAGSSTRRGVGFMVLAGVTGVLTTGMGLMVALGGMSPERTVHRIHDFGGALAVLIVGIGLLASALMRGRSPAALQQVALVAVAMLAVDLLVGGIEPETIVVLALTALGVALHPHRSALLAAGRPSPILGAMALVGSVLLAWYAAGQIALQQAAHPGEPHAHPEGHYAGMADMALALALVAVLASLRTDGWRIPAWTVGAGLAMFGLASLVTPKLIGTPASPGGIMAAVGGAGLILVSEIEARRGSAEHAVDAADAESRVPSA